MLLATALTTIALLPGLLTDTVEDVSRQTPLPILVSDNFYSDFAELYPSGSGNRRGYSIGVDAAPDCNGANACFAADFRAEKGGKPFGRGKVTLTKGRKGRFQPLSCGGSCSPPSISWKERGVTYTIQAKVVGAKSDRQLLTKMANEAIRRGPRG
jgi:hypothetical protein